MSVMLPIHLDALNRRRNLDADTASRRSQMKW